jgi:hypothetical protein
MHRTCIKNDRGPTGKNLQQLQKHQAKVIEKERNNFV